MKKSQIFSHLKRDTTTTIATLILVAWLCAALLPLLFPNLLISAFSLKDRLQTPSSHFWLGTDTNGQSIALLLVNGASTSFIVSLFTVTLSLLVGIPLGGMAGFYGGKIDMIICRVIDILLAFPPMVLPIAIMAFFGGGLWNVILALSLTGWVSSARLVRGQFLSFKEREFVSAAKSLGASNMRLMIKHIFPNTISPLAVQTTFSLAAVIIAEAGLSFLGLGTGENHVSWGGLLNSARDHLTTHPSLAFFPAVTLFFVLMGLNFVGEALRLAFDPKSNKLK